MKLTKRSRKGKEPVIGLRQHYEQIFMLAVGRVILSIVTGARAFRVYHDYMTRMNLVIGNQQAILNSSVIGEHIFRHLQQAKGSWDLASVLSQHAAGALLTIHDCAKDFVRIYREAEGRLGKNEAFAILRRMNEDVKNESDSYRQHWNDFLRWIRAEGLQHDLSVVDGSGTRVDCSSLEGETIRWKTT